MSECHCCLPEGRQHLSEGWANGGRWRFEGREAGGGTSTYGSNYVPVYYKVADPANVSLLMSPADVADGCTMYQKIWIS
jgi:hypothetical protein